MHLIAQTAICFLYKFAGRRATEIRGKDRNGKISPLNSLVTAKSIVCAAEPTDKDNVESLDFMDYKALPMDPVNCFEHEQTN